jgi:chaperonin GroES
MNFQALQDRVVVKKETSTKKTLSGLIIASDNRERTVISEVVAVGDGKMYDSGLTIPTTVKVGEKVMFMKDTGIEVTVDNIEYIILRESEILGIIE